MPEIPKEDGTYRLRIENGVATWIKIEVKK
jgi:hypothetical protein